MDRVVIVGSGASGVHFALSLLKKSYQVLMVDVGYSAAASVLPGDHFNALKSNLPDPVGYFLGPRFESLIVPDRKSEYYGFPPSKDYVFRRPDRFQYHANGFSPLLSFAGGGLAQVWTGGSYPFNDADLEAFPFSYSEIEPHYSEVAKRIGISGTADDLARFLPVHSGLQQPLELDEHSANLLHQYDKRKAYLNENLRCFMGRARVAVLSRDLGSRKACGYSGRCLWGCPSESLYTPSLTLQECKSYPNFEYRTGVYVSHFRFGPGGRITSLAAHSSNNGTRFDIDVDKVVLAAGTLCSSQIVLQSIFKDTGEVMQLKGLMDNRQVLMPFVNLHMLGKPYNTQAYQYPQVAIGLETARPFDYVHGLVTTLKTALIHPIVQSIPFDLRTSLSFFRNIHAGLGLININFPDSRRDENYLTLTPAMKSGSPALAMHYQPAEDEKARLASTNKIFRMLLWKLGCIAPPPMTHVRPMGASVHYAGTIPMTAESAPWTATKYCQSRDFPNLYFADGTTFPALPSKNLTFTLMANAVRVAEEAF